MQTAAEWQCLPEKGCASLMFCAVCELGGQAFATCSSHLACPARLPAPTGLQHDHQGMLPSPHCRQAPILLPRFL